MAVAEIANGVGNLSPLGTGEVAISHDGGSGIDLAVLPSSPRFLQSRAF